MSLPIFRSRQPATNTFVTTTSGSSRKRMACVRYLYATVLFFLVTACVSLPDVSALNTPEPHASPTVTNGGGTLSQKRTQSLLAKRWSKSTVDIATLAALEEAATGVPLISGNRITLLFDGPETMNAMIAAISNAQDHINLETYIFDQDELGLRFADLLIEKQKAGVQVRIIYDSVGTIGTPTAFFQRMKDAGIQLTEFNPVNPAKHPGRWELNSRDHKKILIVDGKIAFTGGVNISSTYANSSLFRSKAKANVKLGWRDTHIKVEGPAVAALQWAFLNTWASQKSPDLPEKQFFPPLTSVGDKIVRVLASTPESDHEIYKAYILAMRDASKSIHITSAYFVPNDQMVNALIATAKRGVDVKIVLPGISDSGMVFHAGRSYYRQLLDGGVKIFELQATVLHAKTAVIDGVWSTVGSSNLDMRSFVHNDEANVIVLGDEFGHEMEKAFAEDLRDSLEVTKEKWQDRPLIDHVKEWTSRLVEYWL